MATLCKQAEESVNEGVNYIVLSDRDVDAAHAAIPSLLAVSAVHHHLISVGKRVQTALIVESGEIRESDARRTTAGLRSQRTESVYGFASSTNW